MPQRTNTTTKRILLLTALGLGLFAVGCKSTEESRAARAEAEAQRAPAEAMAAQASATAVADDVQAYAINADSPVAFALHKAERTVRGVVELPDDVPRTFRNTIAPLDDITAQIELDTNMMMFLAYVSTDADERERGLQAEQDVADWAVELGKREDLYLAVKEFADSKPTLDPEEARMLKFTLRDYKRDGMDLSPESRDKLKAMQKEITRLGIDFEKNIRDDETMVPLLGEELSGLQAEFLEGLKQTEGVYFADMSYPTFLPIMDYCDNEATRKKVWLAYKRRGGQKNVGVLERILKLRAQKAELLGYKTAADFETEVRMAKNGDNVLDFYNNLRPLVRSKAELDFQEYLAAKREHTGDANANFHPWDQSFYDKHLMKTKYAVDAEKVREYFPLDAATEGLFSITQSLYGITYSDITHKADSYNVDLWHEDVRMFSVFDNATGEELGRFTIDLHPRPNKYGHAAQWGLAQHKQWDAKRVTKPFAALVCNFSKPTADKPSLLSHDEVETYFHEFGHCLHTILSEGRFWRFSGTGVERDFVEAPSQMFENWVWDADVLKSFARHYETGEVIPDELIEGMIAARNLGSGMKAEHQFYYGLTDMTYHTAPGGEIDTTKTGIALFSEIELYDSVPNTHFQAAFGHLVGYQAGYYSYMWSLVYASDMFQGFKERGMLNPEAGMYYRKMILARGGTIDGLDLVREFLGREPDMAAFLKHLGLDN